MGSETDPPGMRSILLLCCLGAVRAATINDASCDVSTQLGRVVRTAYSRLLAVQCAKGGEIYLFIYFF